MNVYAPPYYHAFRCIAQDCPDSCCHEWTVDVDADSAAFYQNLPGELGDRLRTVLREEDGCTVMTIENGRCPMWRQDGLCQIQAELGHDALCSTCREFPRLRHDYGDFLELGLELSCPEAARLILSDLGTPLLQTQSAGGTPPTYDTQAMAILQDSRQMLLSFLQQPNCSVAEALSAMLIFTHAVQGTLDGGPDYAPDWQRCLQTGRQLALSAPISSFVAFFRDLEILTDRWSARLDAPLTPGPWDTSLLALARYGVLRYWYQAVSDYDLVGRCKLILAACILVRVLGGDLLETAQLFSKEIENDPDNVDAILDAVYTHPAFTDRALLGYLLL